MPDTTVREAVWCACSVGYVIDGSCKPSTSAHTCRYLSPPRTDAVVVTGRTAQETREAFELLDNRNRIFPGVVLDA